MLVTISSRKTVVPPRLEEVTREKIGRLEKFLEGMDTAYVHFSEQPNARQPEKKVTCEVSMHGHGQIVRCKVAAPDANAAVDRAVDKLEHQLRKLKTKLIRRHQGGVKNAAARNGRADTAVSEVDDDVIVKTKQFVMNPMAPSDAAFQMELLGHSFFLFTNSVTGRSAVVYRRDDGTVGLIEEAVAE